MAIIVPEVFADAVNSAMGVSLRAGRVATDFTELVDEITQYGDKVNFPEIDRIGDAAVMVKGTPLIPKEVAMTDNEAEIKQVGNSVRVYDKDNIQVKGNLKDRMAEQLGDTMAKAIDSDLVAEIKAEAVYQEDIYVEELTADAIEDAFDVFGDKQDDKEFAGILINSKLRKHIKKMEAFSDLEVAYAKDGNGMVENGVIGHWNGDIPVIMTNNGTYESSTKVALLAIVKHNALGYILQRKCNVEEEREAKLKATDIVADELYATKLLHKDGVSVLNVNMNAKPTE